MAQGIGFSIPSDTVKWVVPQLLTVGRVRRGYLGIVGQQRPLARRLVRYYRLEAEFGVEVTAIAAGGPASRGGVREGDVIVAIDAHGVSSADHIHKSLAEKPIGSPVKLTIIRGQERLEIEVVPDEVASSS